MVIQTTKTSALKCKRGEKKTVPAQSFSRSGRHWQTDGAAGPERTHCMSPGQDCPSHSSMGVGQVPPGCGHRDLYTFRNTKILYLLVYCLIIAYFIVYCSNRSAHVKLTAMSLNFLFYFEIHFTVINVFLSPDLFQLLILDLFHVSGCQLQPSLLSPVFHWPLV